MLMILTMLASNTLAAPIKRKGLAGMVVRSKEYLVHRTKGEVEEFIGDVYYRHNNRQMESDWAQWDHQSEIWQARGRVHGQYLMQTSGDHFQVWGDKAEHRMTTQKGWLSGKDAQTMIRYQHEITTGTPSVLLPMERGTARMLEWDEGKDWVKLKGEVHATGPEGEAWADEALYQHDNQTLYLSGRRPVVTYREAKWNGAIQGDTMKAEKAKSRMDADGKVRGWIIFSESETKSRKKKK